MHVRVYVCFRCKFCNVVWFLFLWCELSVEFVDCCKPAVFPQIWSCQVVEAMLCSTVNIIIYLYFYLFIFLFIHIFIYFYLHLFIFLLFLFLFIYTFIFLFILCKFALKCGLSFRGRWELSYFFYFRPVTERGGAFKTGWIIKLYDMF